MLQQDWVVQNNLMWSWSEPLSEPESHIEHRAALDATLFRPAGSADELVLELDGGKLRVRQHGNS
ncbi:MAG: hypothetical protein ABGX04_16045 [Myxococcales bacterium]|nr:hypothetical protein [Myxococcales bacterium]HIK86151.1 hypothetical protein [Myxococcales bacterium]